MTNYRPRLIHWVIAAALILLTALPVQAVTEHCPDGGTKTEANGGSQAAINDTVLDAGILFCVKGSTDATGILTADGVTTLEAYLGNGHDVSYFVIYGEETTPSSSPSPSLNPTPSPTTPGGTAPAEPSPSPTETSTGVPSLPDTATARAVPIGGLTLLGAALIFAGLVTLVYLSGRGLTRNRD